MSVERESAGSPRPQMPASSVTGTPPLDCSSAAVGGLQQLLHGDWMGPQWSRGGLAKRMRWLVADEADMLLSGGFAAATQQLLEVPPAPSPPPSPPPPRRAPTTGPA